MRNPLHPRDGGQAAVEFVLVAPALFLVLFGILQLAHIGFTAMALQRAAGAAAREASLCAGTDASSQERMRTRLQCAFALAPLVRLDPHAAGSILAAVRCETLREAGRVTVRVRYPMPLSVPVARRLFGAPLAALDGPDAAPALPGADAWLRTLGFPDPFPVPRAAGPILVRWMTASATVLDESAAP